MGELKIKSEQWNCCQMLAPKVTNQGACEHLAWIYMDESPLEAIKERGAWLGNTGGGNLNCYHVSYLEMNGAILVLLRLGEFTW